MDEGRPRAHRAAAVQHRLGPRRGEQRHRRPRRQRAPLRRQRAERPPDLHPGGVERPGDHHPGIQSDRQPHAEAGARHLLRQDPQLERGRRPQRADRRIRGGQPGRRRGIQLAQPAVRPRQPAGGRAAAVCQHAQAGGRHRAESQRPGRGHAGRHQRQPQAEGDSDQRPRADHGQYRQRQLPVVHPAVSGHQSAQRQGRTGAGFRGVPQDRAGQGCAASPRRGALRGRHAAGGDGRRAPQHDPGRGRRARAIAGHADLGARRHLRLPRRHCAHLAAHGAGPQRAGSAPRACGERRTAGARQRQRQ